MKTTFGHADSATHWRQRLNDGLAHDIGLVIAKAVQGQLAAGVPKADIVRQVALFGAQNRDGWGVGLTILTALANLLPAAARGRGLSRPVPRRAPRGGGLRRAGAAAGTRAARKPAGTGHAQALAAALDKGSPSRGGRAHPAHGDRRRSLAGCARRRPARRRDRAGLRRRRTLARLHQQGVRVPRPDRLGACVLCAADRRRPDGGGPRRRGIDRMAPACRSCRALRRSGRPTAGAVRRQPPARVAGRIMRRSPGSCSATIRSGSSEAIKAAVRAGAAPADLGRSLAYAAALRVARFGNANEHADWETAHHVFTYANALHQMLGRIGIADIDGYFAACAGVLHGAMALYLTRYLNVPPARIPGEGGERLDDLPADAGGDPRPPCSTPSTASDRSILRQGWWRGILTLGHSPQALIATLAHAVLREDAGFHAYQMLEAGVRQFAVWGDTDEGRHILIAVARYLAAHSPTERAALQTADIARRLMRGGELHHSAEAS